MTELQPTPEILPEHMLSLADAMVQRSAIEKARIAKLGEDLFPHTPTPVGLTKSIETGATVMQLVALENPDSIIDPKRTADALIDERTIISMFEEAGETFTSQDVEVLRSVAETNIAAIWQKYNFNPNQRAGFQQDLDTAATVAQDNSTSIIEVYSNDNLYKQFIKAKYETPEVYATKILDMAGDSSKDVILTMIKGAATAMLTADGYEGEELEEELKDMMSEMASDADFLKSLDDINTAVSIMTRRGIIANLRHFWGEGAEDSLTDETKADLQKSVVESVTIKDYLAKTQQFNDIFALICQQNGWDSKNLSVKQYAEIADSELMKEFKENNEA